MSSDRDMQHFRKLLDSQPPLFCPNRECSARILYDSDEAQAACPACHKSLCGHCGVAWHTGEFPKSVTLSSMISHGPLPLTSICSFQVSLANNTKSANSILPIQVYRDHEADRFRQSLPENERNPEDFALFALAKEKQWSRCPGCKAMMERVSGCKHMTCSLCDYESCYRCGSLWSDSHRCPH